MIFKEDSWDQLYIILTAMITVKWYKVKINKRKLPMRQCLGETRRKLLESCPSEVAQDDLNFPSYESCDNTYEMLPTRKTYERLRVQGIHQGLATWARPLSSVSPNSRLQEGNVQHKPFCLHSLGTVNHYYWTVVSIFWNISSKRKKWKFVDIS